MRDRFRMPDGSYFLSHSVGCLPKNALQSLDCMYLEPWIHQGGDAWPIWLDTIDQFNLQLVRMLGGESDYYCPQSNLSAGLVKLLCALPKPTPDKHTVLMHESAFPSMGFVINALNEYGFKLQLIPNQDAPNHLETWQNHLNDSICAALITHVHSNTGLVSPVDEIVPMCKAHQCLSIVDVAQSAGVIPIDVDKWQCDALLGSCVKWLCGGPGAGFMYVAPNLLAQLRPIDVGWFSHQNPFEMDIHHFAYAKDAKRFWGGTPSIAPYATALGSLQLINEIGVSSIYQHNKRLQSLLIAKLSRQPVVPDIDVIGGTLCIAMQEKHADISGKALKDLGCYFDRRANTLRLSFHIYNSEKEVAALADVFEQTLSGEFIR